MTLLIRRRILNQISTDSTAAKATKAGASSRQRHTSLSLLLLVLLALSSLTTAQKLRAHNKQHQQNQLKHWRLQHQKAQCNAAQQQHYQNDVDKVVTCGNPQNPGLLVCEYDPLFDEYVTRCVQRNSAMRHVGFHSKNYCGACHKCFDTRDQLTKAVDTYLSLKTEEERRSSSVAKTYGYPMNAWCVDRITDFSHLFENQVQFNEDISHWDVSRATTMESMFAKASSFNGDLRFWNTTNVQSFRGMFDSARAFQGTGLPFWETESATDMSLMFAFATVFAQDLTSWQLPQLLDTSYMFENAMAFQQQSALVDGLLQAWSPILDHQVQTKEEMFGAHYVL